MSGIAPEPSNASSVVCICVHAAHFRVSLPYPTQDELFFVYPWRAHGPALRYKQGVVLVGLEVCLLLSIGYIHGTGSCTKHPVRGSRVGRCCSGATPGDRLFDAIL